MSNTAEMTVFFHDQRAKDQVILPRKKNGIHVLSKLSINKALEAQNLFIFTSGTKLSKVADLIRSSARQSHLRALFVRQDVETHFWFQLLKDSQLSRQNFFLGENLVVAQRILEAWQAEAQEQLIADASIVDNGSALLVFDCTPKSWMIPVEALPLLERITPVERCNFEIDKDGSFLYWQDYDVHLDMEDFREAVDPDLHAKLKAKKVLYDRLFGKAIADVRKEHRLSQKEIPGISERQIRRIEKEGHRPKLKTLRLIAQAQKMDLDEYLEAIANRVCQLRELD